MAARLDLVLCAALLGALSGCAFQTCGPVAGADLAHAPAAQTAADRRALVQSWKPNLTISIDPGAAAVHPDALADLRAAGILTASGAQPRFTRTALAESTGGNGERRFVIGTVRPLGFTSMSERFTCELFPVRVRDYRFRVGATSLNALGTTLVHDGLLVRGDRDDGPLVRRRWVYVRRWRGLGDDVSATVAYSASDNDAPMQIRGDQVDFRWARAWDRRPGWGGG